MQTHLTLKSANVKTGPIPVSTTSAKSCPKACPFNHANAGGCYASSGPLALHWNAVTKRTRGESFKSFLKAISALPDGQLWRHNQAGDLPGIGDRIDADQLDALVAANAGKRGFTYTHKPMTAENRKSVKRANKLGFTINLSANNLSDADKLAKLRIAPVVTVLPSDASENTVTPEGRKVVVCPATQRDNVSCATCQLCQRQRDVIIGFPAHGTGAKRVNKVFMMQSA